MHEAKPKEDKFIRKGLYMDINTVAKIGKTIKKVESMNKKLNYKVTESAVVRKALQLTPFEKLVEELNYDINNS